MNLPKILFINNTSRLGAGTSQSLCLLLPYLSNTFEVSVALDRHSTELPHRLSALDIPAYIFRDRTVLFLPQLVFFIINRKIDLIYVNNFCGRGKVAFWASRLTRRPFVWHIRESLDEKTITGPLRHADAIIANSSDTAERVKKFAHANQVSVIPNGVDLAAFQLDKKVCNDEMVKKIGCKDDSLLVINIGRICDQKNQSAVVTVANEIHKNSANVHFIFLGSFQDGVYVDELKELIANSLIPENFHLFDFTSEFVRILMGCHILLHTSRQESQGRVVLEAMAAKIPVLAFDVGGIGESVTHAATGYLRSFGDHVGLAVDLQRLVDDPEQRDRMGQAGFERVQKEFTADKTAEEVKKVIFSVLTLK